MPIIVDVGSDTLALALALVLVLVLVLAPAPAFAFAFAFAAALGLAFVFIATFRVEPVGNKGGDDAIGWVCQSALTPPDMSVVRDNINVPRTNSWELLGRKSNLRVSRWIKVINNP